MPSWCASGSVLPQTLCWREELIHSVTHSFIKHRLYLSGSGPVVGAEARANLGVTVGDCIYLFVFFFISAFPTSGCIFPLIQTFNKISSTPTPTPSQKLETIHFVIYIVFKSRK